ncbi:2-C-methyl-D-erythritol 2,4-cyclodiphosphate synthase [Chitinispirillum alkaliphilum]|nr:2-C-methyl-D-erythritol 2,4-cyclodiphosphate synthase [Chitinispirillum alkaliphilum]
MYISAIGQDSHRFEAEETTKPLVLGGVEIEGCPGLDGNSDADVILHALTNAISGISGVNVLGAVSDELCLERGITDSKIYLHKAIETAHNYRLLHVSISVEASRPHLSKHMAKIKKSLSQLLSLPAEHVGLTATTGEGLTACGRGEGIQALVIVSACRRD